MTIADDVMDEARASTGLTDFGEDTFREGLERLLASLRDEAHLNAAGEAFLHQRIVGYLGQRLQVEDWYRRHPEIDDTEIVTPLIGLGLPRTGSSALANLLAQDPDVRYIRLWESGRPCPPPSTVTGRDPRIPEEGDGDVVGSRRHVPMTIHGPMECQEIMALDFKSHFFQSLAQIPGYSEWYVSEADLTSTFEYQRRVMKLMQWGEPTREWRLKCPSHILVLDALNQAFPDAWFVMTHRDPTDVLLSVADLYADIIGRFTDNIDKKYIGRLNVEHWSLGIDRAVRFRENGADDRFYDIDFRSMQTDPIDEVKGLYAWMGTPVTEEFEARMTSWWTHAADRREPSTHADPVEFGIDLDQVRPLFADYVSHAQRWTSHPTPLSN
ncbi:MAG: sulfotransferase [Gordonia amarae]